MNTQTPAGKASPDSPLSLIQHLGVEEVKELVNAAPIHVVIDVRQPAEWREGTIPGALRIPLIDLTRRMGDLSKDRAYILVCLSGNRSKAAAETLARAGFTQLVNLRDGMLAWYQMGYPLEH